MFSTAGKGAIGDGGSEVGLGECLRRRRVQVGCGLELVEDWRRRKKKEVNQCSSFSYLCVEPVLCIVWCTWFGFGFWFGFGLQTAVPSWEMIEADSLVAARRQHVLVLVKIKSKWESQAQDTRYSCSQTVVHQSHQSTTICSPPNMSTSLHNTTTTLHDAPQARRPSSKIGSMWAGVRACVALSCLVSPVWGGIASYRGPSLSVGCQLLSRCGEKEKTVVDLWVQSCIGRLLGAGGRYRPCLAGGRRGRTRYRL